MHDLQLCVAFKTKGSLFTILHVRCVHCRLSLGLRLSNRACLGAARLTAEGGRTGSPTRVGRLLLGIRTRRLLLHVADPRANRRVNSVGGCASLGGAAPWRISADIQNSDTDFSPSCLHYPVILAQALALVGRSPTKITS